MPFEKSIATALAVAAFAFVIGLSTSAMAAPGTFEVQLGKTLIQKGADKKIYQDLFRRSMPAGTALSGLKFGGKLTTIGISYSLPGGGLPDVPTVGDQQSIENCGFDDVESQVQLGAQVTNSATWSKEDSMTKSFENSVEVSVSYDSPFGVSASVKDTFTYSESRTTTTGQSQTKEKAQTYNLTKTVVTKPGTMTKAQLIYSEKDARGVGYSGRFSCAGKTMVTFTHRNLSPQNEVIVGLAGKCMDVSGNNPFDGARVILYHCHGEANQKWTYNATTREIRGFANRCLDVTGGNSANGTHLIMYHCNGGANQKWMFNAAGEIRGLANKCIDVPRSNSDDGNWLILYGCTNNPNQKWVTSTITETGSVDIERYLSQADRTLAVQGVFDGVYTSNSSSFRVADVALSDAYCAKVRADLGLPSSSTAVAARALPKVPVATAAPKAGGTAVMTARSMKTNAKAYVVVRKPTAQALKSEKPLPATNAVK